MTEQPSMHHMLPLGSLWVEVPKQDIWIWTTLLRQEGVPNIADTQDQTLLAFRAADVAAHWPKDALTSMTDDGTDATIRILLVSTLLPPPNYGERAVVPVTRDGKSEVLLLTLADLDESGRALQQRLGEALRQLNAPADWWPYTEHLQALVAKRDVEVMRRWLAGHPDDPSKWPHDVSAKISSATVQAVRAEIAKETERAAAILDAIQRAQDDAAGWLAKWVEIREMMDNLAAVYTLAAQARQANQRYASRSLPPIPHIFGDGKSLLPIPSVMPVLTALLAYSHGPNGAGWVADEDGLPVFFQRTPDHETALKVRHETAGAEHSEALVAALWEQVRSFSDLDGDVFLAMLAQSMSAPPDEDGYLWITAAQILDYRGIQPVMKREEDRWRRAGHRQEDLMAIAECVARQDAQWVLIRSLIEGAPRSDKETPNKARQRSKGRRRPQRWYTHRSRMTQIAEVILQHELVASDDGAPSQSSFPVAWRYRFGTWLKPFLEESNRKMAWLCQQALKYDPYHETWEKRLARYFMFHLRINAARGMAIDRHVGTLLRELNLPIDERHPERTRKRFERAMTRLQQDEQIQDWCYKAEGQELPARQWLKTWLEWSVHVTASPLTQEKLRPIAGRAETRRDRATTLRVLREAREREQEQGDE